MLRVWRAAAACSRFWPAHVLAVTLAALVLPTSALAQSSVGNPANTAAARSLQDAVAQNEKEVVEREVLGRSSGGGGTTAGALGVTAFPTGRLRTSSHDGLRPLTTTHFSYTTDEGSAFVNGVVALPGTVLGGQVKVIGFIGQNWMSLDLKSNEAAILDPNQRGSATNQSLVAGGSLLWAGKSAYALGTLVGMWGETTLKDGVDDCGHGPLGDQCNLNRYKYDTSGFIATLTAGNVFDLPSWASGLKLDVRSALSYTDHNGERFANVFGDTQKYAFSTWTYTSSMMLFANMAMPNNALLRPYIQAYSRREFGYQNELEAVQSDGVYLGRFGHEQRHVYAGVDTGLTYAVGQMTFGSAIYYEHSTDEHTLGGRLGISWKLN